MCKGYKQFCGIGVCGNSAVLQGPNSDVKLYIPQRLHGFVSGHIHTDPTPFLQFIPESECLVSPIVEYNWNAFQNKLNDDVCYKIVVPHCIRNSCDLQSIKVRHGDIHKNLPFLESSHFDVHEKQIDIYAKHFSQFICTSCKQVCQAEAEIFVFGSITPLLHPPVSAAVRLYISSTLYETRDLNKVCYSGVCIIQHSLIRLILGPKCECLSDQNMDRCDI